MKPVQGRLEQCVDDGLLVLLQEEHPGVVVKLDDALDLAAESQPGPAAEIRGIHALLIVRDVVGYRLGESLAHRTR